GQNLTFSLILYPQFLAPRQIFLLNKLIACALRETVAALLPESVVKVKWPNDLLVDRQKISGILIETSLEKNSIRSAVIGIGLNVNQTAFDPELHGKATSLALQSGKNFDTKEVLARLLERIEAGYLAIRAGRNAGIEHAYLQHLHAYQEDTLVELDGVQKTVHVVGVDADGRLAVQQGGKLYFYAVKEIKFCL
ncbi:MAG TPA: biotin--[acetyl-CoA-carboxylase] ligase, partial [Bacteroidia bacterium]|nr:biotin--[acetyl-CoA-carboxylase] ligase [Bacteroidia bacterium]